ncbi:GH36-type glycosyl hydrolase domain-containing protein [Effusibacillus pohliae]|uniref:GH36-type glycosyl hydrolase domain-containing protein n=1 Tax=Effusibacillus pohliae TaxID=232270 RepID=UPI000365C2B7|nr:glucoamylase family protein [Effusibacillus pohliae]
MALHTEQLRQSARELALNHDLYVGRAGTRWWHGFQRDIEGLRALVRHIQSGGASCTQPAEEWLLDHFEFIEEQALVTKRQFSHSLLRRLPRLRTTGEPRVLSLCANYLEQTDGILDEPGFFSYVEAYQEVSVLTIAELWSIPFLLRVALFRHLAKVMESVRERREVCESVEHFLGRLEPNKIDPGRVRDLLEEAEQDIPLSGVWIAHLTAHLRELADNTETVRDWLLCKLENEPESLDRIVSYEHQLQAGHRVAAGHLISSLRNMSRWDWRELFERMCLAEQTLRQEPTGVYPLLDFTSRDALRKRVEQLARRLHVPENLVAKQAVELAQQVCQRTGAEQVNRSAVGDGGAAGGTSAERGGEATFHSHAEVGGNADEGASAGRGRETASRADAEELPRAAFVAYYLLEPTGVRQLRRALRACSATRRFPAIDRLRFSPVAYFSLLAGAFALFLAGFATWVGDGGRFTQLQWAAILLALVLPASEWAVTWIHWLIETAIPPRPLLRYDFSRGIPAEAATMVVIPVIWSTVEEVQELVDRLELHYLANRESNLHFALLGDFSDAEQENLPQDEPVLAAARAGIETLNRTYSRPGGPTFHLFQRRRLWNPSEGVWMGWERKRGKLAEFVELLKGKDDTTYAWRVGDAAVLPTIRYVITLDADTRLPAGTAQRMVGTLHLPFNRPRVNETGTRVVEGYGVLQPRIGISLEAAMRSRFAALWAGEPGIDPYAFAVSDPYQDGLGQGIFTGKGIFDVDAFAQVLCERIPDNRVLSHDLLEGGFLRAGLLDDIELIDDHPAAFSAYQQRLHRWVRGDWQLFCWLFPRVEDRRGVRRPVDLSAVTRWQIIDNLRRSLLPPVLFGLLLLGFTVLPGSPWRWGTVVIASLCVPVIRQLAAVRRMVRRPRLGLASIGQAAVLLLTLPFQTALLLDAIAKSLYRLFLSRRRLLEWVSSAEVERRVRGGKQPVLLGMRGGYTGVALFLLAGITRAPSPAVQWTCGLLSALWAVAPWVIRWLDRPAAQPEQPLTAAEQAELRGLARQIWSFFEQFVGANDHWLPPDNVQVDPPNGVAHRTSPTNIGLYLACTLAARDFGFLDTPGMIERLERTVATVERLKKWNGHLYNWYDTLSLQPLPPHYVSTVDSGNFVAYLMVVKQGLADWLQREPEWRTRGQHLAERIESLIQATDFSPLFDSRTQLFALGYQVPSGKRDEVLYDLLASEARQVSLVAIALGQVSVAHWFVLGRTMARIGRNYTLLSWSGTMFEFLMPWLITRTYRKTVWDMTYRTVVQRQVEYARQRKVPFGISESGYYAFDYHMNYQYRAFGVPGLGFRRGLEEDLVVAPYATILALPFAKREALDSLRNMERLGARGTYGYYEAIDFTKERLPKDSVCQVVRSFMAHHQGMSLLTLANLLLPQKMYDRFHRDKRVQAVELLLQERMPEQPAMIEPQAMARPAVQKTDPVRTDASREFLTADTPAPEVCVLSNGSLTTVVTNSGSGFTRWKGLAVTRWREDPVADPWGQYLYIRDVVSDAVWSPTHQPCQVPASAQRIQFSPERAAFHRTDGDLQTSLEICVSPELDAEIRRLTLTNTGSEARILEVTTFLEIVLAPLVADEAHPAFSKLFLETEYVAEAECLLARRRSRTVDEKPLWAVHALIGAAQTLGPVEYETDRSHFIGRGYTLKRPLGIGNRLGGSVGAVVDPAFAMRRRLKLETGEPVQLFVITGVAESREEAIAMVRQFTGALQVERTFELAWTRSQVELRHFQLTPAEAMVFQTLAGQVLYPAPLRGERQQSIPLIEKGQSGLWAFGISGDRPIVTVRVADPVDLPFVHKLLVGVDYLRGKGVAVDLAILNESASGYQQDLREALQRAVERMMDPYDGRYGRVYILAADALAEAEKNLLFAVSRVVLRANGPSLKAQIRLRHPDIAWPASLAAEKAAVGETTPIAVPSADWQGGGQPTPTLPVSVQPQDLRYFNGWGGFSADGKEYRILLKNGHHLPAPWINVMANPLFGCLVSELGTGYTWWRNSRECKLTPWSNDPVLDPPGEVCYLRDEASGAVWSATPLPGRDEPPYLVAHGRGYTRFEHERHGIGLEMTVFVPPDDPVKVIRLRIKNRSAERRHLSVTYYAEWVLGVTRQPNASFVVTEWDAAARALLARNLYQDAFRDATAFLAIVPGETTVAVDANGDACVPGSRLSWTADRKEFLGRNGTPDQPAALRRERLSGGTGPLHDTCGAVQVKLEMKPDEEQTVFILLGCGSSPQAVREIVRRYRQPAACEQAFERVQAFWSEILEQISVETPSPEMDLLLNGWLLYQTLACRMWARTAFYQAGGAYGFRDQLQDSLALLHSRPDLTRRQILLHASHQYEEGDVQHWWHEELRRGIRTRCSDDLLWLPYAVSRYLEHTEDERVLDEVVPFLRSEPLQPGEQERYEEPRVSTERGSIFEHCVRAIERALQFGEHGLPLIGSGDWNDGMNRVGDQGRGESVWLGWFLCEVLHRFARLCEKRGETERADRYRHIREQLAHALDQHAWDGQWYRRAFTDGGQWLGSVENGECKIDAIAQSWAVLSGAAPEPKMLQAMQAFHRELVDRSLAVARLLTPPFDRTEPSPGYIQGYPPGIRENGGQYTHGVIWSILAWCQLGDGDRAFELFHMLNPLTHTRTPHEVRRYAGEPYVMAADVYTAEPHKGRAGWTWYTGAAGWMYQAGIEWILGVRRRGNRLYIQPCIPKEWPAFTVRYRYGKTQYLITVKNGLHLPVDGKPSAGQQDVPQVPQAAQRFVELHDDGNVHRIEWMI